MDLFGAVAARYNYRGAFTDDPVTRETLTKIAGRRLTPTGGWRTIP